MWDGAVGLWCGEEVYGMALCDMVYRDVLLQCLVYRTWCLVWCGVAWWYGMCPGVILNGMVLYEIVYRNVLLQAVVYVRCFF